MKLNIAANAAAETDKRMAKPVEKLMIWFRNDLRIHDHEVLASITSETKELMPIYCIDPRQFRNTEWGFSKTGVRRAQLLLDNLKALQHELQKRGSNLYVAIGKPEEIIPAISEVWDPDLICYEKEVASEETEVEVLLFNQVKSRWFLKNYYGKTLIHPLDLPFDIDQLPDIFTQFRKKVEYKMHVRPVFPTPDTLPPFPTLFPVPELPTLQHIRSDFTTQESISFYKAGEAWEMERLHYYLWESHRIKTYKETRNGLLGTDYSSRFSVGLSTGTLSPRYVYHQIKAYEAEYGGNESTYWLIFELLWRDYFRYALMKYGNAFFKIQGFKAKKPVYTGSDHLFELWKQGETEQPFVDANMRELLHTGFMSNRGRQNVASYLCKDLQVDWRKGAAWFESMLLDYDVCSNWGNWAYVAGVGNDPREDRYFNVPKQASMYDPKGEYVQHWLR